MRKWFPRLAVVALLVLLATVLRWTACAPEAVVVRTTPVERGTVEATVANSQAGTIRARRRAKLSTGTSGIVVELAVERGERVAAGALLLRLDDATQRAQLELAEKALAVAEASHHRACVAADRAQRELERNRELAEDGSVALVSVDDLDRLESILQLADAECGVAAAEVERALAAVAVAQAELDKTVLHAPFDAIVAEVSVELGEWVTPSVPLLAAPDLIDAIDPSSLYVSAPIDEIEAGRLAVGQPVRVTIDSHPGRSFAGRIVRVAPYVLDVEQQNRTLEVEVELDDAELSASLLPGTSADVEIVLETREDVLRVPTAALLDGRRVLVVEDGRVAERAVEVGVASWELVEVADGLSVGEEVVLDFEADDLRPGQEVRVGDGGPGDGGTE